MDMREYIAEQLDNMRLGNEKDLLQEYMERIFIPLYDHVEGQYQGLGRRVKDEKSYWAPSQILCKLQIGAKPRYLG